MPTQDTWETQEVINWLINDEQAYQETLGMSATSLKRYVVEEHRAPQGLYDSFNSPPRSSWSKVDWQAVALAVKPE